MTERTTELTAEQRQYGEATFKDFSMGLATAEQGDTRGHVWAGPDGTGGCIPKHLPPILRLPPTTGPTFPTFPTSPSPQWF